MGRRDNVLPPQSLELFKIEQLANAPRRRVPRRTVGNPAARRSTMARTTTVCLGLVLALRAATAALAQTAPVARRRASFAVLGASTVTNTGSSVISGMSASARALDHRLSPGVVVDGTIHAGDATSLRRGRRPRPRTHARGPAVHAGPERAGSRRPDAHARCVLLLGARRS